MYLINTNSIEHEINELRKDTSQTINQRVDELIEYYKQVLD